MKKYKYVKEYVGDKDFVNSDTVLARINKRAEYGYRFTMFYHGYLFFEKEYNSEDVIEK